MAELQFHFLFVDLDSHFDKKIMMCVKEEHTFIAYLIHFIPHFLMFTPIHDSERVLSPGR